MSKGLAAGLIFLLACAGAAQAAVERAIFTARELERRTKLNSYVLGVRCTGKMRSGLRQQRGLAIGWYLFNKHCHPRLCTMQSDLLLVLVLYRTV
jgi:hypothetical protein